MAIGKNVQRLREKRELTFEAVAKAVGTDAQAISQMEKRDSKTSTFAVKLARFFGVDLADLMSEDFNPDDAPKSAANQVLRRLQWVTDDEADILSYYRACGHAAKATAMSVLESLPKTSQVEAGGD